MSDKHNNSSNKSSNFNKTSPTKFYSTKQFNSTPNKSNRYNSPPERLNSNKNSSENNSMLTLKGDFSYF